MRSLNDVVCCGADDLVHGVEFVTWWEEVKGREIGDLVDLVMEAEDWILPCDKYFGEDYGQRVREHAIRARKILRESIREFQAV